MKTYLPDGSLTQETLEPLIHSPTTTFSSPKEEVELRGTCYSVELKTFETDKPPEPGSEIVSIMKAKKI